MLGAPPDPLKLSSATPVVLHASAGPPAKRVRPGFVHGRKADMRAVCSELLQATQAPAAVPRLQCPTNEPSVSQAPLARHLGHPSPTGFCVPKYGSTSILTC